MNGINKCMEDMWYTTLKENWKDICVCVKQNLAMESECDREKKSNVFNWHEKKMHKKNCPTLPSKI